MLRCSLLTRPAASFARLALHPPGPQTAPPPHAAVVAESGGSARSDSRAENRHDTDHDVQSRGRDRCLYEGGDECRNTGPEPEKTER
ncbi:hypothetical protein C450_02174 [Halococcus salifodinae DSM 8989]|uniref:Uncharacterized protein n=1 Tax=Halococcus salifodinae DSM 8989 TaxID=1227456 RepID=M0NFU6_9EURY|nr:hypothetical protein C450_02174 [Halococcus salifodinae DSM 8989]